MISKEGENIQLLRIINPIDSRGAVERWLKEFEGCMRDTINDLVNKGLKSYISIPRSSWLNNGQHKLF